MYYQQELYYLVLSAYIVGPRGTATHNSDMPIKNTSISRWGVEPCPAPHRVGRRILQSNLLCTPGAAEWPLPTYIAKGRY